MNFQSFTKATSPQLSFIKKDENSLETTENKLSHSNKKYVWEDIGEF